YGALLLSDGWLKWTLISACLLVTTLNGMPNGVPPGLGPKSGCRFRLDACMLRIQAALCLFTGSWEMSVFHTLSDGNIGQFGAPGTVVDGETWAGAVSATGVLLRDAVPQAVRKRAGAAAAAIRRAHGTRRRGLSLRIARHPATAAGGTGTERAMTQVAQHTGSDHRLPGAGRLSWPPRDLGRAPWPAGRQPA